MFEYNGASTGLNEGLIKALNMNIDYDIVRIILSDKVGLMPDAHQCILNYYLKCLQEKF